MRLPVEISLPTTASSSTTWIPDPTSTALLLLELQGALEPDAEDLAAGATLAGSRVGTLDLSVPTRPTLRIGHHLLTGALVKLDKPLAILRHTLPPKSAADALDSDADGFEAALAEPRPAKRLRETLDVDPPPIASSSSPGTFKHALLHQTPRPAAVAALAAGLTADGLLAPVSSSPLPRPPATPVSVQDLRRSRHEIIGLVRTKLVFSKRPEPIAETTVVA